MQPRLTRSFSVRLSVLALACATTLLACKAGPTSALKAATPHASSIAGVPATDAPAAAGEKPVAKLLQPTGTSVVSGSVQIDASYVLAQSDGAVVSGSGLISQDGNGIISQDGNGIISQDGNGIISQDGNGIISQDGNGIISQDGNGLLVASSANGIVAAGGGNALTVGGNIVAQGGGNIVAQGGGNIVAAGGGNVVASTGSNQSSAAGAVAQGGGNYGLLAAPVTPAPSGSLLVSHAKLLYGTTLPAAGMVVWVKDLVSGDAVPLGKGPDGKPVYSVYSNASGGYALYLPPSLKDLNFLVVAEVPFGKDYRTGYTLLAREGQPSQGVNEDTATVCRYLRQALRAKFLNLVALLDTVKGSERDPFLHPENLSIFFGDTPAANAPGIQAAEALVTPLLQQILMEIKNNCSLTNADYGPLAERMGDLLIANAGDLFAVPIDDSAYTSAEYPLSSKPGLANNAYYLQNPPPPAVDTLVKILHHLRQRMNQLGANRTPDQMVTLFAQRPYLVYANDFYEKERAQAPLQFTLPKPHYQIEKPSDIADFIVEEYFTLVPNSPYGCVTGECPSIPPDCSFANGCLPSAGQATIGGQGIARLAYSVLDDLRNLSAGDVTADAAATGSAATVILDPSDVYVINAASATLAITIGAGVATQLDTLKTMIRTYKGHGTACSPTP